MPTWPRTVKTPTTRQRGKTSTTVNRTRPAWRRWNTRIADRRAFGPCRTRKGWELRRRVTAGAAALGPPEEEPNRLADAAPGAAEPFPPERNDPPLRSDGNIVPRPTADTEVGAVVEVVGAVFGIVVVTFGTVVLTGSVVVTFGTVVVTFGTVVPTGSVVVTLGTVVVTFGTVVLTGSVVVTFGTVVVTLGTVVLTGSVVVTFGTVVVTLGTVVLTGSVVVTFGRVVLSGSVVVTFGSVVVIRAAAAERPGTALLATKPRRRRTVRAAARFTALEYPDWPHRDPALSRGLIVSSCRRSGKSQRFRRRRRSFPRLLPPLEVRGCRVLAETRQRLECQLALEKEARLAADAQSQLALLATKAPSA
jgi:hypothetical protein